MLHMIAETYGKLPSEVLRDADTFDMMVFDVVSTVKDYHNKKEKKDYKSLNEMYDVNELAQNVDKFKNRSM